MNGPTFCSSLQPTFWEGKAVLGAQWNQILFLLCSGLSKYESRMGHRLEHIVNFPVPSLLFQLSPSIPPPVMMWSELYSFTVIFSLFVAGSLSTQPVLYGNTLIWDLQPHIHCCGLLLNQSDQFGCVFPTGTLSNTLYAAIPILQTRIMTQQFVLPVPGTEYSSDKCLMT